ncbi:MAG: DUF655 domain-containing protein [Candidatus Aenigmarchaeota archaeon]|nr:DUF655 domain-containing protein [Candidatus Aenigmarchaeota archaeon]
MRERKVIVLDYLPNGYPGMRKIEPIVQSIGFSHFTLLELSTGNDIKPGDTLSLEDPEKVTGIRRKLTEKELTNYAKGQLEKVIAGIVKEREPEFVTFFNKATRLSIRTHQLELLPGIGKKHIQIILRERKTPFNSFEDIKKRTGMTVEIEKLIAKRIADELAGDEKTFLFIPKRMP